MPTKIYRAVALAGVALAFAACGQPETGYTEQHSFGFMQGCTAQGMSREMCGCVWGKIEANISRADFDALERMTVAQRDGHPLSGQIEGYAMECAATLPQPAIEPAVEPEATP